MRYLIWIFTTLLIPSQLMAQAPDGNLWSKYNGIYAEKGLHVRPLIVKYYNSHVIINGRKYSFQKALSFLGKVNKLNPKPLLILSFSKHDQKSALKYSSKVELTGMCENRNCRFLVQGRAAELSNGHAKKNAVGQ